MSAHKLLMEHRYDESIEICRERLASDSNDWRALGTLALALRATKAYGEALVHLQRLSAHEQAQTELTPGSPGRLESISCLYWIMGDHEQAVQIAEELAKGVLKGKIKYGDIAGAATQGTILYYMGISLHDQETAAFAIKFMQNRAKRSAIRNWPGPVARYYLGELSLEDLLEAATRKRSLSEAISVARTDLLSRRCLCVALFHDGVRNRALGLEPLCMERMQQCYALEDPVLEQEWYLARYEVERADSC